MLPSSLPMIGSLKPAAAPKLTWVIATDAPIQMRCLPTAYPRWKDSLAMSCNMLKLLARPRRFERPTFAFGGQRSIQLSYGRLWASIDQTPVSGNALDIAGYCSIGLCVKAPSAKVGRSNRLGRGNYCVPRACRLPRCSAVWGVLSLPPIKNGYIFKVWRTLKFGGYLYKLKPICRWT